MKIFICLALVAAVTALPSRSRRGVIHQEAEGGHGGHGSEGSLSSSGYHHEVEHEHAKSHQSIKLDHFHPVPVYVKKEHSHLLKHPLEKGKSEHGIKLLHPKTEHNHGYGLVLEEHRSDIEAHHGGHGSDNHGFSEHSDHISEIEHIPEQHEISEHSQGISDGGHETHGWASGSEKLSGGYESQGLQDVGGHYQYSPIDLSHLGGHEAEGGESY